MLRYFVYAGLFISVVLCSTTTSIAQVSKDAFISHGDMGGPSIMLSADGTATQSYNKNSWYRKGTWNWNGNSLKFSLKSKSGEGISFNGKKSKEVVLSNGKRVITFTGNKVHLGGNNPRSRKGSVRLYPDA